jgi:tetratricopeptide (TPR) repeat protein
LLTIFIKEKLLKNLLLLSFVAIGGQYIKMSSASAQHPSEIVKLNAEGDHYQSILHYLRLPQRRLQAEAAIAAAKSAWALSLPQLALEAYDKVFQFDIASTKKSQIFLSRAIIHFQEGQYELSSVNAENAIEELPVPSSFRAKAWYLWGESLLNLKYSGKSIEKYIHAIEESDEQGRSDIYFSLGKAYLDQGDVINAMESFEKIDPVSDMYPQALKKLVWLYIESSNFEKAEELITFGKYNYPNVFMESMIDYSWMLILLKKGDSKKIESALKEIEEKVSPSDTWLPIIQGSVELFLKNKSL